MATGFNYAKLRRATARQRSIRAGAGRVRELSTVGPPPTSQQRLTLAIFARRAGRSVPDCPTSAMADLEIRRLRQVGEVLTTIVGK